MRKLNFEIILKIIVLMGFTLFFFKIVKSGEISLYVHPRIIPFITASIIGMALIILFLLTEVLKKGRVRKRITTYSLFIIPIVMAFTIGGDTTASSSINEGNDSIKSGQSSSLISNIDKTDILTVDSSNFIEFINKSKDSYEEYVNKKIEIEGFVYKDETLLDNQFAVSRFMMTCCTADMSIVGIVCNSDLASKYDNDTWVKIVGVLEKSQVDGEDLIVIKVEGIERVQAPAKQYVYPY